MKREFGRGQSSWALRMRRDSDLSPKYGRPYSHPWTKTTVYICLASSVEAGVLRITDVTSIPWKGSHVND